MQDLHKDKVRYTRIQDGRQPHGEVKFEKSNRRKRKVESRKMERSSLVAEFSHPLATQKYHIGKRNVYQSSMVRRL